MTAELTVWLILLGATVVHLTCIYIERWSVRKVARVLREYEDLGIRPPPDLEAKARAILEWYDDA